MTCSLKRLHFWVESVSCGRRTCVSAEQIIKVLKEHAAGLSAGEPCRTYGVNEWRSLTPRGLKALEDENRRLKKLPGGVCSLSLPLKPRLHILRDLFGISQNLIVTD